MGHIRQYREQTRPGYSEIRTPIRTQGILGDWVHVDENHLCWDLTGQFYRDLDTSIINKKNAALQEMVTQACTFSPWLHKHAHIPTPHLHTHTPTHSFLRWNNCVPPPAVKPCQCLVSAGIGWVVAGSIRKGQSGSVCSVTLSAGWTDTAGSALSVWAGRILPTETPQRGAVWIQFVRCKRNIQASNAVSVSGNSWNSHKMYNL